MTSEQHEASLAIQAAHARSAERAAAHHIDYAEMRRVFPRQKAALTRAIKSGSRDKLVLTIRDTVRKWDEIGAWPDSWARWQAALNDYRDPDDPYTRYADIDIRDLA